LKGSQDARAKSHRESSTLSVDWIPIQGDHLFQAIPTTHSDEPEKVAAFSLEWVAAFPRNQWSLSPGKRRQALHCSTDISVLQ